MMNFDYKQNNEIGILPKPFIVLSCVLLSLFITSSYIAPIIFTGLAFFAIKSTKASIQALTISFLLLFLNPGIFPDSNFPSVLYWLVFFTSFTRVLWDVWISKSVSIPEQVGMVCLFSFVLLALSIAASYQPLISILKIISFTLGVITVLIGFKVTSYLKNYWISWFITFFFVVVIAGLPLIFLKVGYLRNGRGFQGILNHPQAYGVFVAPLTALLTGLCIFENTSRIFLVGAVLGWFSIFASQARTALIAILTGMFLTLLITIFTKRSNLNYIFQRIFFNNTFIIFCCFALAVVALNWSNFQSELVHFFFRFLQKTASDRTLEEGFEQSRGFLIELSIENFKKHPISGIGFGVSSDFYSYYNAHKSNFLGIPTGAATEKGFLPSAVLEETGIIGTGIFLVFLNSLVKPIVKNNNLPMLWMFTTCFMVNFGEMVFFSFGGMGLYMWLLMGLCYGASSNQTQLKYLD